MSYTAPYRGSCQRLILPSQRNGLPIVSFKHPKPTIKAHPTAMAATRDFQQQLRLHHVFTAQSDPTKPVTLHPRFPRLHLLVPGNQFLTPIVRHRSLDFVPQIVLLDAEPLGAVYGETIVERVKHGREVMEGFHESRQEIPRASAPFLFD